MDNLRIQTRQLSAIMFTDVVGYTALNPMSYVMLGSFFVDMNIEQGLPFFEKAYRMDPSSLLTQWILASAYFWCQKNEHAYPIVDDLVQSAPDWAYTRQLLFLKFGLQGNKERALQYATKELEAEAKDDRHFAFHLAECYAVIGEKEKALELLEYAMELFFPCTFFLNNPLFATLKDDHRFQSLISQGNLAV